MKVTLTIDAASAEALLRALPRCVECGGLGELRLNGLARCVRCAAAHRRGRCETMPWADAAGAIAEAVCPHEAAGRWDGSVDG